MTTKCKITTHVLDISLGRPAQAIKVLLDFRGEEGWEEYAKGVTNEDGRLFDLIAPDKEIDKGMYRLSFETAGYFSAQGMTGFYPYVAVVFEVNDPDEHYHVPLLLSPFGYSTYRGS